MRILIVDDSGTMRRILKNNLFEMGFSDGDIDEASDGKEALEQIVEKRYHLILLDWNMPNVNGYDLLIRLKGDIQTKDIPVIMITTEGGKAEVIAAIKAGVSDYITKPFKEDALRQKIAKIRDKR